MREFETMKNAILEVNSRAEIVSKSVNTFPVIVKIYDEDAELIWSAEQRSLFYADERAASVEAIKKAVILNESADHDN